MSLASYGEPLVMNNLKANPALSLPSLNSSAVTEALQVPRPVAPALRRAVHSVLRRGPGHALRWGWFHCNEHYYERILRIHTRRDEAWNATYYVSQGEQVQYEPLPYVLIKTILARVCKRDIHNQVFLDYGCGMGRVVFMAARKPFKRVIGVELFEGLLSVAKKNLEHARPCLRSEVHLVRADASQFTVPDDVSVVHLFNPFRGKIMAETQAHIRESLERVPRRLTLVYAHADDQSNLFEQCDFLRLTERLPEGVLRGMNLLVYEHR